MPGEYIAGEMMPGTVYRVLGDIGKGGMGRVYEVVDTTIDAHYAAKVLLPSALIRHDLVERMRAEARVLGRLRSKYIVRVFTAGVTQDGVPYFVMDVLRGKPLQKVIRMHRGKKLPLDTARNLMVGVFLGLERAHEQGVVHRDIKPENILVVMDQENPTGPTYPVIVDFGIMSLLNEQTRITGGKQFLGTPGQASPEQCKGDRAAPPNDIYAAGLMLYQLVAGRHPFAEEIKSGNLRDIFGAHLYKTPRPPTDFEPSIDSALEHFIMRCLEKNPAHDRRQPTV
jgi:serine/threonine-protein kinase